MHLLLSVCCIRCCILCIISRLSSQQLADLCVARQLYSSTVMKIKQQRQLLVLQLQQLLDSFTGMQHYRTDTVFTSVAGKQAVAVGLVAADCITFYVFERRYRVCKLLVEAGCQFADETLADSGRWNMQQ